ncbi:MAG: class I fructose-bisphosphate aldolase [Trebonia sp.]
MSAGLTYRMGRIFGRDGRAMILPVDHGLMLGRVPGLEDAGGLARTAAELGCDGLLMSLGLLRATAGSFADRCAPARLLTVDTMLRAGDGDPGTGTMVASVRQAAAAGADAVKLLMPWDVPSAERAAVTRRIAAVVEEASRWEIPVMAEPIALRTPRGDEAVELELHAARIAMELGADIVKVAYPGSKDVMRSLVDELGVPVVILGGPGASTATDLVALVEEAMSSGASGIVIGRQVWQRASDERSVLIRALVDVVHGRRTAQAAIESLPSVG